LLPLNNLRVLETGRGDMAAYCGRLLADAGADVVKIEPPQGGPLRRRGPFPCGSPHPERGGMFLSMNTNKRGVALDLGRKESREDLSALLNWSDILITDVPLKQRAKLGLARRSLHAANPGLVIVSIVPFGESGPYRDYAANDHVLASMSGLAFATPGMPDHVDDPDKEPPLRPSTPIAHLIAGAAAALSALMAWRLTQSDGRGRYVEVSAQEAVATLLYRDIFNYSYGHKITGRRPVPLAMMPNAVMPCKDGFAILGIPFDHMWDKFVKVMDSPDWASLEVFKDTLSRAQNWDALEPLLREWTMRRTGQEIMETCQKAGLPCFEAFPISRVLSSPQEASRRYFWNLPLDESREYKLAGAPYIFSRTPLNLRRPAPSLGQHTREVLAEAERRLPKEAALHGPPMARPLEGVRVIDFGQVVAVPFGTQLMAWMGADVILVESRVRLTTRTYPPFAYGKSSPDNAGAFNLLGSNKRSVTLDLTTPRGQALAKGLVATADVVVENFSTGVMEKFGLGYQELKKAKPDIIMASVSGFGRTGPMARYAAFHSGVNFASGFGSITGHPGGRPRIMGSLLPDAVSSLFWLFAVLAALEERRHSGQGQYIDVSMSEVLMHLMPEAIFDYSVNGMEPQFLGNRDRVNAPQGVHRCQGWDAWVGVSIETDAQWGALCRAIGYPRLAANRRYATSQSRHTLHDEIDAIITRWTIQRTREEAAAALQSAGVPAGPVLNPKDLLKDPHLTSRGFVRAVDHPTAGRRRMLGVPWRISGAAPVKYGRAPLLGEHSSQVLHDLLGLPDEEIESLVREKVIY